MLSFVFVMLASCDAHTQKGNAVLIIIEAQELYRQSFGSDMIGQLQALADAFRARGLPVYRRVWILDPDSAAGRFQGARHAWRSLQAIGSARVLSEIEPTDDLEVNRTWSSNSFSVFAHVGLDARLRSADVNTVVLAGGYVNACVSSTAYHAKSLGYNVIIAKDAVGPYDCLEHVANAALNSLQETHVSAVLPTSKVLSLIPFWKPVHVANERALVEPLLVEPGIRSLVPSSMPEASKWSLMAYQKVDCGAICAALVLMVNQRRFFPQRHGDGGCEQLPQVSLTYTSPNFLAYPIRKVVQRKAALLLMWRGSKLEARTSDDTKGINRRQWTIIDSMIGHFIAAGLRIIEKETVINSPEPAPRSDQYELMRTVDGIDTLIMAGHLSGAFNGNAFAAFDENMDVFLVSDALFAPAPGPLQQMYDDSVFHLVHTVAVPATSGDVLSNLNILR